MADDTYYAVMLADGANPPVRIAWSARVTLVGLINIVRNSPAAQAALEAETQTEAERIEVDRKPALRCGKVSAYFGDTEHRLVRGRVAQQGFNGDAFVADCEAAARRASETEGKGV